jgi:hypothetical protein
VTYLEQLRRTVSLSRRLASDDLAPEVLDQLVAALRDVARPDS